MHKLLLNSQGTKNQWGKKLRDLIGDINSNKDKLSNAKKQQEDLTAQDVQLEAEISRTWRKVEDSHKSEKTKRALVNELKEANEKLTAQLQGGSGWTDEQEKMMAVLRRQADDLEREAKTKGTALAALQQSVMAVGFLRTQACRQSSFTTLGSRILTFSTSNTITSVPFLSNLRP